jgi:hypothetical protein
MAKWKIYLWRSRARDLVFLLETLEKVRCVGSGSRLEDLWGVLAELAMYYIFRVERTEESLMRTRANQSIDRSDHQPSEHMFPFCASSSTRFVQVT